MLKKTFWILKRLKIFRPNRRTAKDHSSKHLENCLKLPTRVLSFFTGWFFGERTSQAGSLLAQERISWMQGDAMSGLVLHPRKQGMMHQRIRQSQHVAAV